MFKGVLRSTQVSEGFSSTYEVILFLLKTTVDLLLKI